MQSLLARAILPAGVQWVAVCTVWTDRDEIRSRSSEHDVTCPSDSLSCRISRISVGRVAAVRWQISTTATQIAENNYTVSQKTSHLWMAITLRHGNGFWYIIGRNVTDKVSNRKTYYYATSNNLVLHYLAKRRNTKIAFLLKLCISALP